MGWREGGREERTDEGIKGSRDGHWKAGGRKKGIEGGRDGRREGGGGERGA